MPYPEGAAQTAVPPAAAAPGSMTDIAAPITPPVAPDPTALPPAAAVPNGPNVDPVSAAARPAVLDLRASAPAPVTPVTPAADPAPIPDPIVETPPAPAPNPTPTRLEQRLEVAANTPKSEAISKFPRMSDITPAASAPPAAEPPAPMPAAVVAAPAGPEPTPAPAPTSVPAPQISAEPALPEGIARQIEAAKASVVAPAPAPLGHDQAFAQAMAAAPPAPAPSLKPLAVVGAAVVVLGMGSYIWLQNAPKLAIKNAAERAGFAASLPGYIPSSYSLNGPVSYAPGQITVKYSSPSITTPLTITQKRTDWDAQSLLDNYVARQSDKYVSIDGQGLTIYLFGSNATWVNHGTWFLINGTDHLSQDQILRVVYSL